MNLYENQRSESFIDLDPRSSLALIQGHSDATFSNFFLETSRPIETKFHVEPQKVSLNGPGHMTNMVSMPIYGKIP